ncbi:MAG TPA: hypothetical protein VHG69_10190 [Thermoleophilaceae bacterium]|nr:hypothetical protein [Thermoleophilaceae bacterium]
MGLLFVFGIGAVAGAIVAAATWQLLRRAYPRARVGWIAALAGAAAAATWVLFAYEWLSYSLSENQPSYYPHSDYIEYRRAVDGGPGLAIGLGYSLLAGTLVAMGYAAFRWKGPGLAMISALLALGAVALPLLVPAVLPRAEYGKDPVFYLSRGPPIEDPATGTARLCVMYGVERPGPDPPGRRSDPELCLDFRLTRVSRRLVRDPSPVSVDRLSVYDIQDELNESDVRPQDPVDPDLIDIEGVELERARWTGALDPPTRPLAVPPESVEELGEPRKRALERALRRRDRETKARILRVERYLRSCRARTGDYRQCVDGAGLSRLGVPIGRGPRQVRVAARGARSYAISSFSPRSGSFSLGAGPAVPDMRVCDIRGSGGCPPSGRW